MPQRYKDEPPAVRVYTVCDESKYLIVRNVPALGCGDELKQLFSKYGQVEECKPMDAEECEPFTDVYWIKYHQITNARFAKRKLGQSVFLGNILQISYAPEFECLSDMKEKLEGRRKEVLARLKSGSSNRFRAQSSNTVTDHLSAGAPTEAASQHLNFKKRWDPDEGHPISTGNQSSITRVSSDQDYFPSESMNKTVQMVRDKLNKIESSSSHVQAGPASKRSRIDNRRRI